MMAGRSFVAAAWSLAALALLDGCVSIPEGHTAIDDVAIRGTSKIDESQVTEKLATTTSPKFLGVFRGVVYDYELLNRATLQRDLERIERYYRARGYYDARVHATRVLGTTGNHARVEIQVEEGLPVVNDVAKIEGIDGLPPPIALAVRTAVTDALPKGAPFDEDGFKSAETAARRALTDRGYAYAKVTREAFVDLARHVANVVFTVKPEQPATFGKIVIVGLDPDGAGPRPQEIPESAIRRTANIDEGTPYSTTTIDEATQALLDLEVFSAVEIVPELPDPPPASHVVPLTIKVSPSALRALKLGGGIELDQIKTDVHLLVGWEDHNFLGGLRDFTVDFKPGVVLYPTRITNLVAPTTPLPEERLRLQLKQPGFIEARTAGFLRPEFNVFPILVKSNPSPDDPVLGYREGKVAAGADRTYKKLYWNFSHNVQVENPFSYKGPLDPALSTLIISYPELLLHLDFRDDRVRPHKGIYLGNDLQVAGGPFLGNARDVKIQPEVRTYAPLAKKVTLASRASVGLLFPFNYGDVVQSHLGDPITPENRTDHVRDIETVLFRGFFSGGPNSNRGFPVRGVAPHGIAPFLNPATVSAAQLAGCDSTSGQISCAVPIGGLTLWEFSNEVRFTVKGPLSAATFCDMSDVSPRQANIRLDHLHLACGLGVRYDTPVGPLRLDIGYRIQPLQVLGFANEDAAAIANPIEGYQPKIFGLPVAVAFGIGEAY